ncbi:PREDICTED: translation initiation factor IF-2-like [Ficedula albicollis]|uniref:translation initiation factor IF-2-like n=1 Tax=Ficedula albicollis TaxID=59894 RepID=UPI0007AD8F4F|nr:PREDICTED: translation initiation factor IF-2-like [Ficedula albicollis]
MAKCPPPATSGLQGGCWAQLSQLGDISASPQPPPESPFTPPSVFSPPPPLTLPKPALSPPLASPPPSRPFPSALPDAPFSFPAISRLAALPWSRRCGTAERWGEYGAVLRALVRRDQPPLPSDLSSRPGSRCGCRQRLPRRGTWPLRGPRGFGHGGCSLRAAELLFAVFGASGSAVVAHYFTESVRLEGTFGDHRVQPPAGSPGAGYPGTRPGCFGMSPETEISLLWAACSSALPPST